MSEQQALRNKDVSNPPCLVKLRRELHANPESGWTEFRTSAMIAEYLFALGFEVFVGRDVCQDTSRMGVPATHKLKEALNRAMASGANTKWAEQMEGGFTGVVARWKSPHPGPVIALRFDIDANDLTESNAADHRPVQEGFVSEQDGVMHACGHDGHAAIGLGTAYRIKALQEKVVGEVRFLFQPAEEGCRGAKAMVDSGWLDGVDFLYSAHIGLNSYTFGEVVASTYGFLATTKMDVTFHGKAAHAGGQPEQGNNALLAAATASLQLHAIARHSEGYTQINVGTLSAGSGRNVIPDTASMQLETRGETSALDEFMVKEAERRILHAAQMYGVTANISIVGQGPGGLLPDVSLVPLVRKAASGISEIANVIDTVKLTVSEDIVYMINKVRDQGGQASFMLLGSERPADHHQNKFDFDERVLDLGAELFTDLVILSAQS